MVIQRQKAKKPRLPRGQGRARPTRVMTQGEASKLCDWVHQNGFKKAPSVNQALAGKHISRFAKTTHLIPLIVMQLRSSSFQGSERRFTQIRASSREKARRGPQKGRARGKSSRGGT
jgi:hypothetical protein